MANQARILAPRRGSKSTMANSTIVLANGEIFIEDDNGTCFYLDSITNGTSVIKNLYEMGCQFIIFREYGIPNFDSLVVDTMKYISSGCSSKNYVTKYKKMGDSTNFFFKRTIYKVK